MRGRVNVRARVLVEGHLVGRKSVARNGEPFANRDGPVAGIHRKRGRKKVREIDDIAETFRHPDDGLRQRPHTSRRRTRCNRADETTARHLLLDAFENRRCAHTPSLSLKPLSPKPYCKFSPCTRKLAERIHRASCTS